jgi:hypothetical protein
MGLWTSDTPRAHRFNRVSLCYSFGVRPKNTISYFTFTGVLIMSLFNSTFVLPKFLLSVPDPMRGAFIVLNMGTQGQGCGAPPSFALPMCPK